MSKLYEEAIEDARKLKEVAEDNAKKAILEAVTPKIRNFIEQQLLENEEVEENEEAEEAEEAEENEEVILNEKSLSSLLNMLGVDNDIKNIKNESAKDALFESVRSAFSKMPDDQKNNLLKIANKVDKTAGILESKQINNNIINEEISKMSNDKFYEVDLRALREAVSYEDAHMPDSMGSIDEEEQELEEYIDSSENIDDLMNEIKLILDLGDEIDPETLELAMPEILEEDEEEGEEEAGEEGEEEAGEEGEAGEEDFGDLDVGEIPDELEDEPTDETYEIDGKMLKEELMMLRKAIREGKMDHHFGGKGPKKLGSKKSFGGGAEGSDAFTNPPQINKLNEVRKKLRQLSRINRTQNEKLNKYRSAVKTLREQLEDLNLFNAKLLYVNKLLQNKTLVESEKKSIIKALDEAKSLTEAKSLYKSLTETFTRGKRGTLSESRSLGSSSRTTTSSSAGRQSAHELDRWQTLAGLK